MLKSSSGTDLPGAAPAVGSVAGEAREVAKGTPRAPPNATRPTTNPWAAPGPQKGPQAVPDLTGPLFSLGASGTIGKTLTYSRWRGIKYVRSRVIPANPRSADQKEVRVAFAALQFLYTNLPAEGQLPAFWAAKGRPLTNRNLFTQWSAFDLRTVTDMQAVTISQGQTPAPPATGASIAGGAGDITWSTDTPAAMIEQWAYQRTIMVAFLDFDPTAPPYTTQSAVDTSTTPNTPTVTTIPWTGSTDVAVYHEYALDPLDTTFRYGANALANVNVT